METWVDIEGYENLYQVSDKGNIRSLKTGNKRVLCMNNYGYLHVGLTKNGNTKTTLVSTLVAKHFVYNPDPENYTQVNHKDEVKTNNNFSNLEWCTPSYNTNYSQAKKVLQLKEGVLVKEWPSTREAGRNGYNAGHVASCCRGERGSHKGFNWKYKNEK